MNVSIVDSKKQHFQYGFKLTRTAIYCAFINSSQLNRPNRMALVHTFAIILYFLCSENTFVSFNLCVYLCSQILADENRIIQYYICI